MSDLQEMDDANYIARTFDARTARILVKLIEDVEKIKEYFGGTAEDAPEDEKSDDKTPSTTAKKTAASKNG